MTENVLNNNSEAAKNLDLDLKTNPSFDLMEAEKAKKTLQELK